MGVPGLDAEILDLKPGYEQRGEEAGKAALAALQQRLQAEKEPRVREDLEILIDRSQLAREGHELEHKLVLPYFDVAGTVFQGLRALCDQGLMTRRMYPEIPPRVEYELTDKGRDVIPIIEALRDYGARWLHPEEPGVPRSA